MPALDTNILIRYLVKDDAKQSRIAAKYVNQFTDKQESLFIPISVALETEWVLRSRYQFQKDSITEVFVSLLQTGEIIFQDEATIERAINLFREQNVDFADCLHLATAYGFGQLPLITFDRRAARLDNVEVLSE